MIVYLISYSTVLGTGDPTKYNTDTVLILLERIEKENDMWVSQVVNDNCQEEKAKAINREGWGSLSRKASDRLALSRVQGSTSRNTHKPCQFEHRKSIVYTRSSKRIDLKMEYISNVWVCSIIKQWGYCIWSAVKVGEAVKFMTKGYLGSSKVDLISYELEIIFSVMGGYWFWTKK